MRRSAFCSLGIATLLVVGAIGYGLLAAGPAAASPYASALLETPGADPVAACENRTCVLHMNGVYTCETQQLTKCNKKGSFKCSNERC